MSTHSSSDNLPTLRWGIIGCGNVTEKKSGPAFNKVAGSSLLAVMRRDGSKAKDYAARHGVPKWYDDAQALINDPDINAIYIATPPDSHEDYAIAAMQAGKPVYVEKPMAVTAAACLRMQDVANITHSKLSIAHYRRGLPMFRKVKQLLAEKIIGEIRTVRISMLQQHKESMNNNADNWRVNPAMAGAGYFYDLAPHQLDLVVYFFGEPVSAIGFGANQAGFYPAEDVVSGLMRLQGNVLFTGQWCYTVGESAEEDLFEIQGSKGRIRFPVFGRTVSVLVDEKEDILDFEPPTHIQQPMIENVVQYFTDKGPNPCSAAEALVSMRVMESFAYNQPFTTT
jgi:predicted dehydrogenase